MHFIERCRTLEYAPLNRLFALCQFGHGPVAEIPIAPADHLARFLGILPKHRIRGRRLPKPPFCERPIRWALSLRPSDYQLLHLLPAPLGLGPEWALAMAGATA